jgi:hypothetical protein
MAQSSRRRAVRRYEPSAPATLGSTAKAHMTLVVWCKDCRHKVEPDPAEMAERYGAETTAPDWGRRLVCGQCGSRNVNFVVSG